MVTFINTVLEFIQKNVLNKLIGKYKIITAMLKEFLNNKNSLIYLEK
jgi:hypothetical protein